MRHHRTIVACCLVSIAFAGIGCSGRDSPPDSQSSARPHADTSTKMQTGASDPRGVMGATWGMTKDDVRTVADSWPKDVISGLRETEDKIGFMLRKLSFETCAFQNVMVFLFFEQGALVSGLYVIPVHQRYLDECTHWYDEIKDACTANYGAPSDRRVVWREGVEPTQWTVEPQAVARGDVELRTRWTLATTEVELVLAKNPEGTDLRLRYARR